jgi:UDP-GlcNAc:undecaprenyl-phosphate GlcNAc-1-phosphate transferase
VREYLLVFAVAAVVSYLLCVVARELAGKFGATARVRDRDVHDIPIPYFGGIAMLGGLAAGIMVAQQLPFLGQSQPQVFHDAHTVLIAGALICAVGALDDLFELDAITKFGGQLIAVGFMVLNGVQFFSITLPVIGQLSLLPSQSVLLTMLMVAGTVNALNFVDGLDGLAGGIALIGAFAFFVFCYQFANVNGYTLAVTAALLCAAVGGACLGFLPHNFFPARIFMGDSGSMLLGLVLAGATLTLTGQFAGVQLQHGSGFGPPSFLPTLLPIVLPLSILMIPLLDLVLAVVRRTRRGQAFYQPDKEHLHHRLLEFGHSQRRAAVIMWMWAALIAFGAVSASLYSGVWLWLAVAGGLVVAVTVTFVLPRLRRPGEYRPV